MIESSTLLPEWVRVLGRAVAAQGTTLPLIATVRRAFQQAGKHGWADENLSSVVKLYE